MTGEPIGQGDDGGGGRAGAAGPPATVPVGRRLPDAGGDGPADGGPDDAAAVELPLTPEARAKAGADGVPVTLGDGRAWLLADGGLSPLLEQHRDRLFDQVTLSGGADLDDVRAVAWALLRANYQMTGHEAAALVVEAPPAALAAAVMDAALWREHQVRTYSVWARSALLANGLDPDAVAPRLLPHVLRHLVHAHRAVPLAEFADSAVAAAKRKRLLGRHD